MTNVAWVLLSVPFALVVYAYLVYPALLRMLGAGRPPMSIAPEPSTWPLTSICVPVYNEEAQIRGLIESLLRIDYPSDRLQILIVSDASSDGTDGIVREYEDCGVELLRMPMRGGKGAVENAASECLRGEIVVNTDASIRIRPGALKLLVAHFDDSTVGVASGRDISVARVGDDANAGESRYVGYEMWVRALETRFSGIVGASGCFYAIRHDLHRVPLKDSLSRDFAAALIAREHGYRAVSVDEAVCLVPRAQSLQHEYKRKVRTITRGMETLYHKRHLLHPARYGSFAWMLWSHKVARWAVPAGAMLGALGVVLLAMERPWARMLAGAVALICGMGWAGWVLSKRGRPVPRALAVTAFFLAGNVAALHALINIIYGDEDPLWEPTRRDAISSTP